MPYKDPENRHKWDVKNKYSFSIRLMRTTDADIIEWLQKQPSRQGAIKDLIREELARSTTSAK